jgi:hypothetical protein
MKFYWVDVASSGVRIMHTLALSQLRSKLNRRSAYENIRTALLLVGISTASFSVPITAQAAPVTFFAALGNFENPPTGSAGTGRAAVTMDVDANTLSIDAIFSGLTGLTSAAHIHCCVAPPGNAIVATQTPSFIGFPLGVQAGTFSNTYDTTLASTYNAAFVTQSGGVGGAEAALFAGLLAGQAYFNIHTSAFGTGEIRGFLQETPIPAALPLFATGLGALGLLTWRRKRKAVAA